MRNRSPNLPTPDKLVKGRVYRLRCRNLSYGVWDGESGFIGIREKFGNRYLDTEYHWDLDDTFGTVYDAVDTGVDVPEGIEVKRGGPDVDQNGREVYLDKSLPNPMGWKWEGWYRYRDTNEICPKYKEDGFSYYATDNRPLFKFLDERFKDEDEPGWMA